MKSFRLLLLLFPFALAACRHGESVPPDNPFDAINYDPPVVTLPAPDSASLVGLHQYIFSVSCAVPGCHDGSFDPDFRTVQSTYSTLLYQPVIKNTSDGRFRFRVIPFDAPNSWLHYRVTTNDQVLGRMPLYDNPLTTGAVAKIEAWIAAGAPDLLGNVSRFPDRQPQLTGLAAFLDFNGFEYRVDTIRSQPFAPFGTLTGRQMTIWFGLQDDSTDLALLQDSELKLSADRDDFSSAAQRTAIYSPAPKIVPDYYGPGVPGVFYWKVELNTGDFPVNAITYFRYYTRDEGHAASLEFPRDSHPLEYKFFMSFFVAQ
jgi:hypothetical protein